MVSSVTVDSRSLDRPRTILGSGFGVVVISLSTVDPRLLCRPRINDRNGVGVLVVTLTGSPRDRFGVAVRI